MEREREREREIFRYTHTYMHTHTHMLYVNMCIRRLRRRGCAGSARSRAALARPEYVSLVLVIIISTHAIVMLIMITVIICYVSFVILLLLSLVVMFWCWVRPFSYLRFQSLDLERTHRLRTKASQNRSEDLWGPPTNFRFGQTLDWHFQNLRKENSHILPIRWDLSINEARKHP